MINRNGQGNLDCIVKREKVGLACELGGWPCF